MQRTDEQPAPRFEAVCTVESTLNAGRDETREGSRKEGSGVHESGAATKESKRKYRISNLFGSGRAGASAAICELVARPSNLPEGQLALGVPGREHEERSGEER